MTPIRLSIIYILIFLAIIWVGSFIWLVYSDISSWTNEPALEIDDEKLADAIFKAEGGKKAQYLYGIRSVKYKDEKEARQICLNTIRNNKIRFKQQNKYDDYLEFLGSRYAPINADNDKKGLNRNWIKNVKAIYKQEEAK